MDMFTTILTSKSKICTDEAALANYSEQEIEKERKREREKERNKRKKRRNGKGRLADRNSRIRIEFGSPSFERYYF